MNKIRLLESLYQYHFQSSRRRVIVYASTFAVALLYALINALILGRPERSVVLESAALTVILQMGLPIAYVLSNRRTAVAAEKRLAEQRRESTAAKVLPHGKTA